MAGRITEEQIIQINELYLELGIKSQVAKAVGVSPASVTKYIIPNYVSQATVVENAFASDIPDIPYGLFDSVDNWGELCILSEEEKAECDELRKEILI